MTVRRSKPYTNVTEIFNSSRILLCLTGYEFRLLVHIVYVSSGNVKAKLITLLL